MYVMLCKVSVPRRISSLQCAYCCAVVEKIDISRQPLPNMEAIYFLSPTDESINLLIQDFKNEKSPQYRAVHLFFTTGILLLLCSRLLFLLRVFRFLYFFLLFTRNSVVSSYT